MTRKTKIGSGCSGEDLKDMYHRKELRDFVNQDPVMRILKIKRITDPKGPMELIRLLQDVGMTPGSFDADALFDLDLDVIQTTSRDSFQKLRILVGEVSHSPDPLPLTTTDAVDNLTASSHDASAAEDGSDTSSEPPRRMSLGPSGASKLEARSKIRRSSPARNSRRDNGFAPTDQATDTESSDRSVGTLQKFFNAPMDRYLAEEREANKDPASLRPQHQGSQDVEMEFIRSSDHGSRWEYDPDDVDFPPRHKVPLLLDPQEFTGKDQDEDRARAWISKIMAALMRDQASDDEKCLTFADLLAGPAKNWYHQLSPLAANEVNYYEVSRSSTADLEYRTILPYATQIRCVAITYIVAGLRARLKIKDGNAKERREHVDHYIETLEDQDLAERLTLLRLTDADDLEEVLRARDRAKNRQKKAAFESSKYRQKPTNSTPSAPAKQVGAIRIQANDSGSDSVSDGSGGSDFDVDSHRKIFLAASKDVTPKVEKESANLDPRLPDRDHGYQDHNLKIHGNGFNRDRCSHCGSRKHSDLVAGGVLRARSVAKEDTARITVSSELHDWGKCPMEEFYNQIWFNLTKHMSMLPEAAEKMLN
ncbi:LOW QUALITY PROTEIN: hypothetical protein PHMEG_00029415 [Phytophthora megakarya]|uniref:Eukaryotic/viral aspartic protease n=1 Tax=Phytophthora megakarya TaxID=4795 RepID=A0A225V2Q6_9STRA|nr:LOW QUALITY PROTEIN: hypothetical protein PHMEG_00029415 [Phytophthora megakarya]